MHPQTTQSQAPIQTDVLVRLKRVVDRESAGLEGEEPQVLKALRAAVREIETAREVLQTIPILPKQVTADYPWGVDYNRRLVAWLAKAKRVAKGF